MNMAMKCTGKEIIEEGRGQVLKLTLEVVEGQVKGITPDGFIFITRGEIGQTSLALLHAYQSTPFASEAHDEEEGPLAEYNE